MVVLVGTAVFSFSQKTFAENASNNNDNKPEKKAPDQDVVISAGDVDQNNSFVFGSKILEMERTLPFYSEPFSHFQVDFSTDNKKFFQAGEEVLIRGSLSYTSRTSEEEVKKAQDNCLADQANKTDDQKKAVCEAPPVYYFPSFSDVSVLAQVWRQEEDKVKMQAKGDNLVDEFYIGNGFKILENEKKDFGVRWKIPENLKPGKYYVAFFINQHKSFTLSGFPVNIFSPSFRFDFDVIRGEGNSEGGVRIDKDNIKINGKDYSQVLPAPSVQRDNGNINFEIPVLNPSEKAEIGAVTYKLQRWTQEDPGDLITEKTESFNLAPGSQESLRFGFSPGEKDSFCNLEVTVQTEKTKTMTDIHFAVAGIDRGIIRFLGIAKGRNSNNPFPLFCLRNAQWQGIFDGKLKLAFSDASGKSVKDWESEGKIEAKDGVCFVIKDQTISDFAKSNCLKIDGKLEGKNGELFDEKNALYNCGDLENAPTNISLHNQNNTALPIVLQNKREALLFMAGLVFILVIVIIFGVRRYLKNKDEENEIHIR